MRSQGQSRKLKVAFLSIAVFLITTYFIFSFFSNLFGNNTGEAITTFDILKTIVPYTASFSFTLYSILAFIFGRESKKVLPKGFFTPTSWLDIKHNSLVAIDNNDLVFLEIEDNHKPSVQSAYQSGADIDSLIELSGAEKHTRVPLNEISNITSEHNAYFMTVEHGEENYTVNYMMPIVKAHSLVSIKKYLSNSLEYSKKKKTRLRAIMPSFFILIILAGIGFFFSSFIVSVLLIAFGLYAILPLMIQALVDPAIVETWQVPKGQDAEELSSTA